MARQQDASLRNILALPSLRGVDPALIRELNTRMERVASMLAELQGTGDRTPTFHNDVDMGRNRVRNVGWSERDDDVAPRAELIERALYERHGEHSTPHVIHARNGVRVPRTTNMDHVVPLRQIEENIASKAAPKDAEYLTLAADPRLSKERIFVPGSGLTATDNGPGNTYVLNAAVGPGGAAKVDFTPTLTESGSSFTFPVTPTIEFVYRNGILQRRDDTSPPNDAYSMSGAAMTLGRALIAGERLESLYAAAGSALAKIDFTPTLTETGDTFTYPSPPSISLVFLNGISQRQVMIGIPVAGEYKITGTGLKMGHALIAGERLESMYA